MRLIDACGLKSVMIDTLERIKANPKMDNQEAHLLAAFHTVGQMVDDAPTIDAVPVVRCMECVNSQKGELFGGIWCHGRKVWADHFCSCGKRREDGENNADG